MKCVTKRYPIQPRILYKNDGIIEFKNSIGTKVTLIKSQCSKIVTMTKNHYTCGLTLDDSDIKLMINWLIEEGMINQEDLKFKNVFKDAYRKHSKTS